jgi:hypothetical protein
LEAPFDGRFFFFRLWSQSAERLQLILCHIAGFYKPTIPQSPPSHLRDYSTCNNARLEFFGFPQFLIQALIQVNGALKMVSTVGGLNPGPLGHEYSALATRPRLLA